MKSAVFAFLAIGLGLASFTPSTQINLLELQKGKNIDVEYVGNPDNTHYQSPVLIRLHNRSKATMEILIPAGLRFETIDPGVQDIISTEESVLALAPGAMKSIPVKGVCIQASNRSPNSETIFTLSKYGSPKMKELAEFLDAKDIHNSQAQQAMWVLSDKRSPYHIIGLDNTFEKELVSKTCELAGLPQISDQQFEELKEGVINPVYHSSLRGYFKFQFPRKTKVQIAIFNSDHVLIKEVLNKEVEKGFHKIDYQLETTELEGQKIYSQMIAFNKVVAKRTITLHQR